MTERRTRGRRTHPAYVNLADLLTHQAAVQPDAEAAGRSRCPSGAALTWAELDQQVGAVAGGLAAHGLVAGHRVGLVGPNSIEFVVAYLAVLRAGLVAVPVDPDLAGGRAERDAAATAGSPVVLAAEDVAGPRRRRPCR